MFSMPKFMFVNCFGFVISEPFSHLQFFQLPSQFHGCELFSIWKVRLQPPLSRSKIMSVLYFKLFLHNPFAIAIF